MTIWYQDRETRRLILLAYLPWLAGLSLAWEIAQLPLYTIWRDASPAYRAFAVAHCTAGDILIGSASLALALILGRERIFPEWRWGRIVGLMMLLGAAYTLFSEWLNTTLFRWTYSELMPMLNIGAFSIGVSPLAQWFIVPPLALHLARRGRRRRA